MNAEELNRRKVVLLSNSSATKCFIGHILRPHCQVVHHRDWAAAREYLDTEPDVRMVICSVPLVGGAPNLLDLTKEIKQRAPWAVFVGKYYAELEAGHFLDDPANGDVINKAMEAGAKFFTKKLQLGDDEIDHLLELIA